MKRLRRHLTLSILTASSLARQLLIPYLTITIIVALAASQACSGSNQTPAAPTAPFSTPSVATVKTLSIDGKSSLTAVGETSQLTANATLSDGTVKDVTSSARWTSNDPSIISVSSSGLLTVVHYGTTNIQASYVGGNGSLFVKATRPGTFTVSGWVREPGQGIRIENVRVLETLSGTATMTNGQGKFSIADLTSAHLRFEKDGYEPVEMDPTPNGEDNVAMQRVVRVLAGQTVTPAQLAPHDIDYILPSGEHCYPCRLIRVVVPAAGRLHLRLTWSAGPEDASLALWVAGQQFRRSDRVVDVDADIPVTASEVIVYAGQVPMARYAVPFTLATSLTP